MKKAELQIDKICDYLIKLRETSNKYYDTLSYVNDIYRNHLDKLKSIITPKWFNHKFHLKSEQNHLDRLKSVITEERINSLQNYFSNRNYLDKLKNVVPTLRHTNWNTFTEEEKKLTENTVLLVNLLYNMCKVELVLKGKEENDMNSINTAKVEESIDNAITILTDKKLA